MSDTVPHAPFPRPHAPRTIYVATRNANKIVEIRACLAGLPLRLEPLPDDAPEVAEDGATFAANARKKAEAAAAHTGQWALADDSGIEADALGGAPGIYSARYAGVEGPDADGENNRLLLQELETVPAEKRTGRFRCVIALARPGAETLTFEGRVEGLITHEPRGSGGFGYDPLFYYPPFGCTFGEVELARKNTVSHRANALKALRQALERI